MGEIRLTRDGAERGELRLSEPHHIRRIRMGIRDSVKFSVRWVIGDARGLAEMGEIICHAPLIHYHENSVKDIGISIQKIVIKH